MFEDEKSNDKSKCNLLVEDYLKNSSLHGLQYLLQDKWTV